MIESFSDWFFIVSLIIISLWLYKRWLSNRFLIVQIHRLPLRQLDEEGLEVAVPNHERDHDVIITREFSRNPPLWATQVERQYGVAVNNWVDFERMDRVFEVLRKNQNLKNNLKDARRFNIEKVLRSLK